MREKLVSKSIVINLLHNSVVSKNGVVVLGLILSDIELVGTLVDNKDRNEILINKGGEPIYELNHHLPQNAWLRQLKQL